MTQKLLIISSIVFLAFSCKVAKLHKDIIQIKEVMNLQEKAWSDGDLEKFMEGYWKSDSLKFIGNNNISYGWETTLANYKKGYPTTNDMGKLTFEIIHLEKISSSCFSMVGKYTLTRKDDAPSGHFSLLWKKINGKWVIVQDHTS